MWDLAAPMWILAAPLPWIVWWLRRYHPPQQQALLHPRTLLIAELSRARNIPQPWLGLAGITILILGLSGPRWFDPAQVRDINGRDIIIALDMSASMRAEDFQRDGKAVTRFEAVRAVAGDFIALRPNDRIGIIVFADDAYTLVPLTHDHALATQLLNSVEIGMAGDKTALGDALALSLARFERQPERERVVVLFTDGAATGGQTHPDSALAKAVATGVRVHAVGIGGDRQSAVSRGPVNAPEFVAIPFDEARLQTIAARTNGKYFRGDASNALVEISREIDRIEQTDEPLELPEQGNELYWLPLVFGLLFIAAQHWRDAIGTRP